MGLTRKVSNGFDRIRQKVFRLFYKRVCENPTFVVGCGHSGTTLMLRILGNHSMIYPVPYESRLFMRHYFRITDISRWEKEMINSNSKIWAEKTPKHITRISQILDEYPNSKIVMMVRDGRENVLSLRKRYGSFEKALDRYVYENFKGAKYLDHPNIIKVKIEDFTESPGEVLSEILSFIGLPYEDRMLKYSKNTFDYNVVKGREILTQNQHQLRRTKQVNSPITKMKPKWEKECTDLEKEEFLINSEFRYIMKVFGY